jgi:ATP-dependent RNA helicase RhlE
LLDLLNQGALTLKKLDIFVLDEADRMLDMGFIHDIRRVIAVLPAQRQTLFFSATMPSDISRLASTILRNPTRVEVTPAATPIEVIDQCLYMAEKKEKSILLRMLLQDQSFTRALVFTRTKHGANKVCESLLRAGVQAAAIHGNKSQNRRQEALAGFQDGTIRILVATDIAARGIDVEGISHVFNYDLPEVPETYVHRIGRTARAGATGVSISFCSYEEQVNLRDIERLIRKKLPERDSAPLLEAAAAAGITVTAQDLPRTYNRGGSQSNRSSGSRRFGQNSGANRTGRVSPESFPDDSRSVPRHQQQQNKQRSQISRGDAPHTGNRPSHSQGSHQRPGRDASPSQPGWGRR